MNKYELTDANGSIQYLGYRHIEDINIEGKLDVDILRRSTKDFIRVQKLR